MTRIPALRALSLLVPLLVLAACGSSESPSGNPKSENVPDFPQSQKVEHQTRNGSLADGGVNLFGGGDKEDNTSKASPIGVNSFLWRATLDTLSFMPLVSADPFGGVIITDWYEDPKALGERFKVNALILDKTLRADGVKVTVFKQSKDVKSGQWRDEHVDDKLGRTLEDTILTRARQLKVRQLGK